MWAAVQKAACHGSSAEHNAAMSTPPGSQLGMLLISMGSWAWQGGLLAAHQEQLHFWQLAAAAGGSGMPQVWEGACRWVRIGTHV